MTPVLRIAAVMTACGSAAFGQAGWILTPQYEPGHTSVNPAAPRVRISGAAYFSPIDYAYAAARWDVRGSESGWVSGDILRGFALGSSPPRIIGPDFVNWLAGQIFFPPHIFPNTANPIPVFEMTWEATDFRRREVEVTTHTIRFDVFISPTSPQSQSRLGMVMEGRTNILVTPAPGPGPVLLAAACGVVFRRRRRPA